MIYLAPTPSKSAHSFFFVNGLLSWMLEYWDTRHETTIEHCPASGAHAILAERTGMTGYEYRVLELGWDRGRWRAGCKVSRGQKPRQWGCRLMKGPSPQANWQAKMMNPTDVDGSRSERNEQAAVDRANCGGQRWVCCCIYSVFTEGID